MFCERLEEGKWDNRRGCRVRGIYRERTTEWKEQKAKEREPRRAE